MEERHKIISAIRNPLSIIALFVFLVEGLATIALSYNTLTENQRYWFVAFSTVFPFVVFVVFSLIVWSKPENFYGPLDYSNDRLYVQKMKKGKMEDEVNEIAKEEGQHIESKMTIASNVARAEQMALNELQKEFNTMLLYDVRSGGGTYLYDGLIQKGRQLIYVEVKYLPTGILRSGILGQLKRFNDAAGTNSEKIVAIVSQRNLEDTAKERIKTSVLEVCSKVDFRFYVLD